MRVLVFQHTAGEHPAAFIDLFHSIGATLHTVKFFNDDPIPTFDDYDFLLVMGGPIDVWEVEKYPWLTAEITAIQEWVTHHQRPYFGICLGHQLLAQAMGGTCEKASTPEIGIIEVTTNDNAQIDPVFTTLQNISTFQWHGVEVSALPPDSVCLGASNDCQNQIIRVGQNAYGVQFHPETIPSLIGNWLEDQGNKDAISDWLGPSGPTNILAEVKGAESRLEAARDVIFTGLTNL
jgi:GMP synthase-like glutamine amidotransferase